MKRRYYIIIALCSYIFFALANTPAAKVIALAKENMQLPAQFFGVQGSVWNGRAESVVAQAHRIEELQWSINPLSLLLARVSADVEGNIENQTVIGHISVRMNGDIHAENVRSRLKAEELQKIINMPFGELAGVFNVHVDSLIWSGEGLPETFASVKWQQAKLTLVDSVDLGQVMLDIKPGDNKDISIAITNSGGVISLDGTILLDSNKQYKLKMDFKPAADATEDIKQSLAMFAKRQSNGSYKFNRNGNLNQLGM